MSEPDPIRDLQNLIYEMTESLSPLECALILCRAFSEAYEQEWEIQGHADGRYSVKRKGH